MARSETGTHLLAKARDGDRRAFDELAGRVEDRIRAFIHSRIRREFRDRLDVNEIVQDTLVRAFRSIGGFRGEDLESFVRWVMGVARIAVIKAVHQAGQTGFAIEREVADSDVSPSKALRRHDRFERLQDALSSLSEDYRDVIRLARIDGLSMKGVAQRMGRSPDAAKKLLGRALRKLRERFGDTESLHLPDRQLRSEEKGRGE